MCLQCHSPTASFSELKDPDCSDILSGGKSSSATARFYRCFFGGGEKSFDESGENVVSYPATALDNDIPPAVANSSRAEDVPEDKCHYQLSVIWSAFQLHNLVVVCVKKESSLQCWPLFSTVFAPLSVSSDNVALRQTKVEIWEYCNIATMMTGCKEAKKWGSISKKGVQHRWCLLIWSTISSQYLRKDVGLDPRWVVGVTDRWTLDVKSHWRWGQTVSVLQDPHKNL